MAMMLLEWVFTSIFLILVVLALRAALGKRMRAGLRYALWAVVLVRLLVPVQLFTSPIAGTWVAAEQRVEQHVSRLPQPSFSPQEEDVLDSLGGQAGPSVILTTGPGGLSAPSAPDAPAFPGAPEPPAPPDLTKAPAWLGWTWLAGSLAVAAALLLSNLRFYGKLRRERVPLDGADLPLRVYVAVDLPSPCLFGIFRPAVYATPEAASDPDMLRHVLAHEYTHFRHGDHIWSLLRCAALAVHWWNPLVWVSARLSQRDGELACDEGALKRLGDGERMGYGNTLLTLVTAKPRPSDLLRCATTMAGDKKSLKERVTRIACAPKRIVWVIVVTAAVTALACLCAFGQAAPEDGDRTEPSLDSTPVISANGGFGDAENQDVPVQVREDAREFVRQRYESLRDDGIFCDINGFPVIKLDPPKVDQWRIDSLTGPYWRGQRYWDLLGASCHVELWNVVYSFHTTPETRDKAWNLAGGATELTDDGWLTPINYGAEYLLYTVDEWGNRTLYSTSFGEQSEMSSVLFRRNLRIELARGGVPEDLADSFYREEHAEFPLSGLDHGVDLNRNGVPELVQVVDQGTGCLTVEVWEGNKLLWVDEAYNAHAGENAVFLCTLDGEDYLLRYHPYMGQGWCDYGYQLFTLSDTGEELVKKTDEIEFDINFQPIQHQSFEPEAIVSFLEEVNGLLENSVQLVNTADDLLSSFEKEGRLYDSLIWLDWWEPVFARDEGKSLLDNLRAFQEAMENVEWYASDPVVYSVDEAGRDIRLHYQDMETRFDAEWDEGLQPRAYPEVMDLDGDGREEIVCILAAAHGTGVLVENLYVFDAGTLEQYDTSTLNLELLNTIQSTGDEENFYLSGPGMDQVVIPKKDAQENNEYADMADSLDFQHENYIAYTVEDGRLFCWVGCDASGRLLNYIGWVQFELHFASGRTEPGMEAPGYVPINHFSCTAQYIEQGPDGPLF